jgi:hypothetical protein
MCYSHHVTCWYFCQRPPWRSPQRHLSTSPLGSTSTSPRGAYHNKPLYVYTSSVITPLPLDLAWCRLLGLLTNDYFEYLDNDPMGFCCRNRMNIIFRAYTASTMYQALLSFNLGFGSRLFCSTGPQVKQAKDDNVSANID